MRKSVQVKITPEKDLILTTVANMNRISRSKQVDRYVTQQALQCQSQHIVLDEFFDAKEFVRLGVPLMPAGYDAIRNMIKEYHPVRPSITQLASTYLDMALYKFGTTQPIPKPPVQANLSQEELDKMMGRKQ